MAAGQAPGHLRISAFSKQPNFIPSKAAQWAVQMAACERMDAQCVLESQPLWETRHVANRSPAPIASAKPVELWNFVIVCL